MPASMASRLESKRTGWPSRRISPASGWVMPNRVSASSVRPAPSRPVRPRVSPRRKANETSAYSPRRVRPAHLQHDRGRRQIAPAQDGLEGLAGHQLGQPRLGHAGGREDADEPPVAQDGDALADLEHLGQAVADQDHGDAVGGEAADDLQERVGLGLGQRRGGLVHEDEARVGGERPADRHHLPPRDRELAHRPVEIEGEAEPLDRRARHLAHPRPVHPARPPAQAAARSRCSRPRSARERAPGPAR